MQISKKAAFPGMTPIYAGPRTLINLVDGIPVWKELFRVRSQRDDCRPLLEMVNVEHDSTGEGESRRDILRAVATDTHRLLIVEWKLEKDATLPPVGVYRFLRRPDSTGVFLAEDGGSGTYPDYKRVCLNKTFAPVGTYDAEKKHLRIQDAPCRLNINNLPSIREYGEFDIFWDGRDMYRFLCEVDGLRLEYIVMGVSQR